MGLKFAPEVKHKFKVGDVVKWNTASSGELTGEITFVNDAPWEYEIKCTDGVVRCWWNDYGYLSLETAELPDSRGAWRRQV